MQNHPSQKRENHSPQKRVYKMSARAHTVAATRERLLQAAWEQFATRPYESVRLQDVAAAAKVSAQTLHSHFGSKDGLLTAAYTRWGQLVIAEREAVEPGQAQRAIEILFDHYEAHGEAVLRMLSQEDRVPAIRQMTSAGRLYHRHWARRVFRPLLADLRGQALRRRLAAIAVATDVLTWRQLRLDMGLDREEAEAVVAEMVGARTAVRPATRRPRR